MCSDCVAKYFYFYLDQFSMPISSSPASTPSAWCHAVWEKTRQYILSSAPPWCTQRRLNPSRDASLSSTTLTVSSQAFLYLSRFSANKHKSKSTFLPCSSTLSCLSSLCFPLFILHPVSFSPPHPLSCFSLTDTSSYHALVSLLT